MRRGRDPGRNAGEQRSDDRAVAQRIGRAGDAREGGGLLIQPRVVSVIARLPRITVRADEKRLGGPAVALSLTANVGVIGTARLAGLRLRPFLLIGINSRGAPLSAWRSATVEPRDLAEARAGHGHDLDIKTERHVERIGSLHDFADLVVG